MANDRVHIKCKGCGAWKMLLSYNGTSLRPTDSEILDWLSDHGECHPNLYSPHLNGDPGFSLHTDDDVGFELAFNGQNASPPNK